MECIASVLRVCNSIFALVTRPCFNCHCTIDFSIFFLYSSLFIISVEQLWSVSSETNILEILRCNNEPSYIEYYYINSSRYYVSLQHFDRGVYVNISFEMVDCVCFFFFFQFYFYFYFWWIHFIELNLHCTVGRQQSLSR